MYGLGVCAEFGGSAFKPLVGGKLFFVRILKLFFGIVVMVTCVQRLFRG